METIKFKGYEWIKLEENEGKTRLFLKKTLDKDTLEKCVEDKWYLDGREVRLAENVKPPFNWENSYVKKVVLENFKKSLGIECNVDLISKEEVEELNEDVKKSDNWYWTKTPSNYGKLAFVFLVGSSGYVDDYSTYSAVGLRPVIQLDTKLLKQSNDIEKLDIDTEEMTINGYEILQEQVFEVAFKVNELIEEFNKTKEVR